jgi:hypothetical protein
MSENKKTKWVDVQKENDHFFIRAEVGYLNKVIKIRFGIDKKTAVGIRTVLREKPFKEKYGNEYSYWHSGYMTDKSANDYGHYIEIRLGKMRRKTKKTTGSDLKKTTAKQRGQTYTFDKM